MGLSHEQLVWAGILIGTDFNEGVLGIGPKKALKLVQGAKSTDDINEKLEALRQKAAANAKKGMKKSAGKSKTDDDVDSDNPDDSADLFDSENQAAPLASVIFESALPKAVDFAALEDLFLRPKYASVTRADLKRKPVDIAAVKRIMVDENDFSLERVSATLERAFKNADEKQGTLGQWS